MARELSTVSHQISRNVLFFSVGILDSVDEVGQERRVEGGRRVEAMTSVALKVFL